MRDYAAACASFSAASLAQQVLRGSLDDGLNACVECCDRWVDGERVALLWMGADGSRRAVSFAALQADAARFANLLSARGIGPGDVVAGMLPRVPELLVTILGTWRAGAIYQPLFFFTGYWEAQTPSFQGSWYVTGDVMHQDADGYLHFVGGNDDIITSAGYRIGPADAENVLIEHPSVAEAAVIGKPDPERTEIVKAFVVLRGGIEAGGQLAEELRLLVRRRLSAHAYPRKVTFVPDLPKTPSGKVQRFLLRQRA